MRAMDRRGWRFYRVLDEYCTDIDTRMLAIDPMAWRFQREIHGRMQWENDDVHMLYNIIAMTTSAATNCATDCTRFGGTRISTTDQQKQSESMCV